VICDHILWYHISNKGRSDGNDAGLSRFLRGARPDLSGHRLETHHDQQTYAERGHEPAVWKKLPHVINGERQPIGESSPVTAPHEHAHVLGHSSSATADQVDAAIRAGLATRPVCSRTPGGTVPRSCRGQRSWSPASTAASFWLPPCSASSRRSTGASFLMAEERPGPLLVVHVYDDANSDQMLRQADATSEYALTCSIFAADRGAIMQAFEVLRDAAGMTCVNGKPTGAPVGRRASGGNASGPNDKTGSPLALPRWVNGRLIKENLTPPHEWAYPYMGAGRRPAQNPRKENPS
jgi:delta 1-pyrroline-5-carboxylate dehydrogenase